MDKLTRHGANAGENGRGHSTQNEFGHKQCGCEHERSSVDVNVSGSE